MWETWVQSLSQEDPLEEGMATHTSILAWRIPMDRGAGEGYNPRGLKESGTTRQLSTKHLPWSRVVNCKIHLPITTLLSHPLPQRLWAWPWELLWPVRHQQTSSRGFPKSLRLAHTLFLHLESWEHRRQWIRASLLEDKNPQTEEPRHLDNSLSNAWDGVRGISDTRESAVETKQTGQTPAITCVTHRITSQIKQLLF